MLALLNRGREAGFKVLVQADVWCRLVSSLCAPFSGYLAEHSAKGAA